jgi:hypothetical protein
VDLQAYDEKRFRAVEKQMHESAEAPFRLKVWMLPTEPDLVHETGNGPTPKKKPRLEAAQAAPQVPKWKALSKRFLTVLFAINNGTANIPCLAHWKGKTAASRPNDLANVKNILQEETFWATENSVIEYGRMLEKWRTAQCRLKKISDQTPAIVLMDHAPVHMKTDLRKAWARTFPKLLVVYVPKSCTAHLQPLDVGFFNVLKPKVQALYDQMLTGKFEHTLQDFALSASEQRKAFVECLNSGLFEAYKSVLGEKCFKAAGLVWDDGRLAAKCESVLKSEEKRKPHEKTVFPWGVPGTSTFVDPGVEGVDEDGNDYPSDDSGSEGDYDTDLDD